jgi:hypothetical protein
MSGSPKSYRRAKLSKENAERLAQGMQPKEMRGRFGVHIPNITDVPPLVDVPIWKYRTEDQEGELLVAMARGQWWEEHLWHLPMEGGAGKAGMIRSTKMKRQGAKKGTPDYALPILQLMKDGRTMGGLWIELKASDGRPSEDQLKRARAIMSSGQAFCFAYGADAALAAIRVYLKGEWPA